MSDDGSVLRPLLLGVVRLPMLGHGAARELRVCDRGVWSLYRLELLP